MKDANTPTTGALALRFTGPASTPDWWIEDGAGFVVLTTPTTTTRNAQRIGADARRSVAAWNACLGIPTEELQAMAPGAFPLGVTVRSQACEAKRQAEAAAIRRGSLATLQACQAALAFIESSFIADHGQRDIGETWAALVEAILAGREALYPGRRFIARPHDCGQTWELIDTRHPLSKTHGPRVVMSGFQSAATITAEELRNEATTP